MARWPDWLEPLYRSADALDAAGFARGFAPEGRLTFGNGEPAIGPGAIEAGLNELFAAIAAMSHRLVRVWESGDETMFESAVTYGRLDGTTIVIPAASAYTRTGGLVTSARVYCDMSPVFSP
ncbi:MAG TPA: nuclear transport factor 2 family protein [Nocardioides sp.]|uniref:nuclear transport factor 2 family protein n=1 Tax=Nocardioides sp. TaxID=35761 RepID=UPI002CC39D5D|nr:nuclear transport factor 2 family protein [Nocardioides sp.]HQR25529.1 nuclear transport factor 2 family protein [Nocardioides sp.]